MKIIYDEIHRRFPEARHLLNEGEIELPYLIMDVPCRWLKTLRPQDLSRELIERVIGFDNWCQAQPRGKDAGDDIPTIYIVGFFEHLFDSVTTRKLIPHLVPYEALVKNAVYLKQWVGLQNYEAALQCYSKSEINRAKGKKAKKK